MNKIKQKFLTIFHMDMNHVSLNEDYIRNWLRQLADMGYNSILWELEDKVCWETCAQAVWPEAMSKEQFCSILDYSRELGLSAIPLLQTVGHAEYIMKHEAYAHMREQEDRYDCYCTSNPEVRQFLKELIGEYLDLFGDVDHFHLGGDEAYVFASCPTCRQAVEETSRNQIYANHIMDISEPISARGIRPGIWCDMILRYPENVECIPKELSIWDWNYWDGVGEPEKAHVWGVEEYLTKEQLDRETIEKLPEIIDEHGRLRGFYTVDILQRLNYDVFLCSAARSFGDTVFCGRYGVHSANIIGAAQKAVQSQLLGHCVTSWAVRIGNLDTQQAWIAAAPKSNAMGDVSYEEIMAECGYDLFGMDPAYFYEAIENIALEIPFVISSANYGSAIQWTGMKDSMPAPKGYIKSVLEKWKNEDDGIIYDQMKALLADTGPKIIAGKSALERFAGKVSDTSSHSFLNHWLDAAEFQVCMVRIAKKVFDRFEQGTAATNIKTVDELKQIHADCNEWMLKWMTPKSAQLNSDLIFKPFVEYFEQ